MMGSPINNGINKEGIDLKVDCSSKGADVFYYCVVGAELTCRK